MRVPCNESSAVREGRSIGSVTQTNLASTARRTISRWHTKPNELATGWLGSEHISDWLRFILIYLALLRGALQKPLLCITLS